MWEFGVGEVKVAAGPAGEARRQDAWKLDIHFCKPGLGEGYLDQGAHQGDNQTRS